MSEIIIDGVNVAECEWMIDGKDVIGCNSYICCCEEINNCSFKQLQRAKAELEQYKKSKQASYEAMQAEWNNAVNELRDVKVENEKLKKEVKEIRTWEELKLSKYKQALEEVREWLLKWRFNANIIKHTNEPLNKINEVLN